MKLLKWAYEKKNKNPAPYYYSYSIGTILTKPLRKFVAQDLAANCPFNNVRIMLYRLCGFKIGRHCFIGMKCYLDDMCYDLLTIGDDCTISYGVYFACHGRNQGHLPIRIEDGVYIGMRSSVISKTKEGKGLTIGKMQSSGQAHWLIRMFRKVRQRSGCLAELLKLKKNNGRKRCLKERR